MASVKEEITNLVKLQEIDAKIYGLRIQHEQKPAQLKEFLAEADARKKEHSKSEEELKRLQIKQREKELELKTKEEAVKKYQSQLYQVKTNKEYYSMQKEIEGLKADSSVIEEDILRALDEVDAQKRRIEEGKKLLAEEESKVEEQKRRIEAEMVQINTELENLSSERERVTPSIEKEILERYERILRNGNGLAIVPVKDDVCGGCFINLPPQVINEIRMDKGIVICESCSRMLYLETEPV